MSIKTLQPSPSPKARFGWGGRGLAAEHAAERALISVAAGDIRWSSLREDPLIYQHYNPARLAVKQMPMPSDRLIHEVKARLYRQQPEGSINLSKPGFVALQTPFKAGSGESLSYVYARLLALNLLTALQTTEETTYPHVKRIFYVTDETVGKGKSGTTKHPHCDDTARLTFLVYGPNKGFSGIDLPANMTGYKGGNPQVTDVLQLIRDNHLSPKQVLYRPYASNHIYAVRENYRSEAMKHYSLSYDLRYTQGRIMILLLNNDLTPGSETGSGVLHGATPIQAPASMKPEDTMSALRVYYSSCVRNQGKAHWAERMRHWLDMAKLPATKSPP